MKQLSIITLSYNTEALLRNCLKSINNWITNANAEVFVVDNASHDSSVKMVENEFPKVKLLKNADNLGFAKANNLAIKEAEGKYILLLNSDTEAKEGALEKMVEVMEKDSSIAILGPRLVNNDNSLQASAGVFYSLWTTFLWLLGFERFGFLRSSPDKTTEVDWVSGAAFLIRKEVIEKIGFLDENFFMYLEEMELCYRAKKQHLKVIFYPEAVIYHKGLGSGNKRFAIVQIYKGLLYFFRKHKSMIEFTIVKFLLTIKAVSLIVVGKLLNNDSLTKTYEEALSVVR